MINNPSHISLALPKPKLQVIITILESTQQTHSCINHWLSLCRSVLTDVSGGPGLHSFWWCYKSYNQLTRKIHRYLCVYIFSKRSLT